jgi:predicted RNase H-like HicB family nuclease
MECIAVFEKVAEGYVAFEGLPGSITQVAILQEAREDLREALKLILEPDRALAEESIQGREVV